MCTPVRNLSSCGGLTLQICHFYKNFYPAWVGGIETLISLTSNFLSNYDSNLQFCLVTDRQYILPLLHKGFPKCQYYGNLEVFRLGPNVPKIVLFALQYRAIVPERKLTKLHRVAINQLFLEAAKIKKVREANVLHLHGLWDTEYEELALRLSDAFAIPLILHLHGTYLPSGEAMAPPNATGKAILEKSNAIVVNNMNVFEKLKEWKLEKKAYLIPNGVDIEKFGVKGRNLREKGFNIAFIGRLSPIRDPLTAIYAFKILLKKIPDAKMHIAGNGPLEDTVRRLVLQLDLGGSVVIYGSRMDIDRILKKSDVFWATSNITNYPSMSLLEALASSLPVVATDIGLTRELIVDRQNGLLVSPGNPSELADATKEILTDDTLRNFLSINARATAEKYDFRKICPRIAELYYSVSKKR